MPANIQPRRCLFDECECGRGIFETDADLRTVNDIAEGIACAIINPMEPLEHTREWWTDEYPSITPTELCKYLDAGLFDELFWWWQEREDMENQMILFAALAMWVGATIGEEQRDWLAKVYKQHLYSAKQKYQFKDMLHIYIDGKPWDWYDAEIKLEEILDKIAHHARY